jgi:hypothetical protein
MPTSDLRKTNSWRLKLGTNRNHGDDRSAVLVAPLYCATAFRSDEERQHRQKHIINVLLWKASFTAISRKTDIRIPIWQKRFEHVNAYRRWNFGKRRNFMNADTG